MSEFTGQLLFAISTLAGVIAFLFRLLSQQWNDRLKFVERQLRDCQDAALVATEQTSRVADLAERRSTVAALERRNRD
jgi:hypothetical protein